MRSMFHGRVHDTRTVSFKEMTSDITPESNNCSIVLNVENYSPQSYQSTLLTIGVVVFAVAFNTSLATRLPLVEGIVLILHIAGFL